MRKQPDGISPEAGRLLLLLLEQQEPFLTWHAMDAHFSGPGEELLSHDLLVQCGSDLSAVVDDGSDRPVSVIPNPIGAGFGYFSDIHGWVDVPVEQLARYRVDVSAAIHAITRNIGWQRPFQPQQIADDMIWELGAYRVTRRGPPTQFWFARRLGDPSNQKSLIDLARRRPDVHLRGTLTSSSPDRYSELVLPGHLVVSAADLRSRENGLNVDPEILRARFGVPVKERINSPVHLSVNGKVLTINGSTIIPIRGEVQSAIIRLLVNSYKSGRRCSTGMLLEKSGSRADALRQAIGRRKWEMLHPYLDHTQEGWIFQV